MPDSQHAPSVPVPPSHSPQQSSRRRNFRILLWAGAVAGLGVLGMLLLSSPGRESEVVVGNKVRTIQLNVLNGVGEAKLAQRMTDYLRSRGFDVVEIGNYQEELEKTLVIDRTGNSQAAIQVARSLGVPLEQVIQRIDKTLYLDVSVFIGKDYPSLQPFK